MSVIASGVLLFALAAVLLLQRIQSRRDRTSERGNSVVACQTGAHPLPVPSRPRLLVRGFLQPSLETYVIVITLACLATGAVVAGTRAMTGVWNEHADTRYDMLWFNASEGTLAGTTKTAYASHTVNGAPAANLRARFVWTTPLRTLTCTGVTDASGTAACRVVLPQSTTSYPVTVRVYFPAAGDGDWTDNSFVAQGAT